MAFLLEIDVDDKGTLKVKQFVQNADKQMDKLERKTKILGGVTFSAFTQMARTATRAASALVKLNAAISIGAFTAGAAAIALVTKEAASLEQKLDFVAAVLTDKTVKSMEELSETVIILGRDTAWMSTQVAEAAEFLGKAGLKTEEVIGALPGTLDLATAGTVGLSEAANITASVLRMYNIQADEAAKVSDILAFTAVNSNTTITELGTALSFVGPIANTAGIELQELVALLGLFANMGIKGSVGGTAARRAIASLLAPTREQAVLMRDLNLSVHEADGTLTSFTDLLLDLQVAGATTGDVLKLFGVRGGPAMAGALNLGSKALENFTDGVLFAGGVSQEIADEKLDNFNGQITILKSSLQTLAIALGLTGDGLNGFTELVRIAIDFVNTMTDWVRANSDQIEDFKNRIMDFIFAVGSAFEYLLPLFNTVVIPGIAASFETMGTMFELAITGINMFVRKVADSFNQLLGVSSIIANVFGMDDLATSMRKAMVDVNGFTDTMSTLAFHTGSVTDTLTDLTLSAGGITQAMLDFANANWAVRDSEEKAKREASTLFETIENELDPAVALMAEQMNSGSMAIDDMGDSMFDLSDVTSIASDDIIDSVGGITDAWIGAADAVKDTADNTKNAADAIGGLETVEGFQAEMSHEDIQKYINWLIKRGTAHLSVTGGAGSPIRTFQEGGVVPGRPDEIVPALLHGGETVVPAGGGMGGTLVVELNVDGEKLAKQIINLDKRNVGGMKNQFRSPNRNIKNYQEVGS